MPVLPSGRYVGIMSERARYHATRQKLRISEKTPHHRLYPLIDILVESGDGSSRSELGFSGYTLGDMNWVAKWPEADRNAFLQWVREPAQVQRIEQARRRLLAEETQPKEQSYRYPKYLYSLLRQRIETLKMSRATAQQWRATLTNMTRDGIRQEELQRSGLLEFLGRKPPEISIDKSLLLEAIDFSAIQPRLITELECDNGCRLPLDERVEKLAAYQLEMAGLKTAPNDIGVVRYRSGEPGYRIGVVWRGGKALSSIDEKRWFVLGPYSQVIAHPDRRNDTLFGSLQEAMQIADLHATRNHRVRCNLRHRAQYEYMSLCGGEDYREWLVTLPHYQQTHFNGHFYERNILLHIRSKVRRSEEGARVLFIEELQSDWLQASLRYGSRGGVPQAPFRREWVSLALKLMLMHVVENGLDGIAWTSGDVHELRYDKVLTPLRRLYDQDLPQRLQRLGRHWGAEIGCGHFKTRQPWLHAARSKDNWRVEGGAGKFVTRARYSKEQAMALIDRHSKVVTLQQPIMLLPETMRSDIAENGLPLFGESMEY